MAFPTTGVLDNFNRADSSGLGASWTGSLWAGEPTFDIVSNAAKSAANYRSNYYNVSTFGPDAECYATWSGGRGWLYVRVNGTGATLNAYGCRAETTVGTNAIIRIDNGVETVLGAAFAIPTSGDQVGISAVGSTITCYYNGVSQATRTDATYSASGYLGFEGAGTCVFDNFGGGTIVTATTAQNLMLLGAGA